MVSRRCRRLSGWSGGARSLFLLHRVHSRGTSRLRLLVDYSPSQGSLSCLQGALGPVLGAWPYSRRISLGPSVEVNGVHQRRAPVSTTSPSPRCFFSRLELSSARYPSLIVPGHRPPQNGKDASDQNASEQHCGSPLPIIARLKRTILINVL